MANVIEFTIRGIDKFSGPLGSVSKTLGTTAKSVAKFGAVAAGAATATFYFTKKVADSEDRLAKFSRRIGVAVDQLSAYEFVAKQSGVESAQFDLAVQRMTRRVGEAAQGFGSARQGLIELGINAKQFAQLPLSEQMTTLADKFKNVHGEANKLRLAFTLFDSEGTSVIQMLKQGSPAMQAMAKDAERLGLVVSKQAAANAEEFTNAMGRAWGSVKGVSRAVADELIPVFTGLGNKFADATSGMIQSVKDFTKRALHGFFTFVAVLHQIGDTFKKIFDGNTEVLMNFLHGLGRFAKSAVVILFAIGHGLAISVWEGVKATTHILNDFGTWLGKAIYNWTHGKNAPDLGKFMAESLVKNIADARKKIIAGIQDDVTVIKLASKDAGKALQSGFNIDFSAASDAADKMIEKLQVMGDAATESAQKTTTATKTFAQEMLQLTSDFENQAGTIAKQLASSTFDMLMNTAQSVGDAFSTVIVEGGSMANALQSIAKGVLKNVLSMLIRIGVQRLILAGIEKAAIASQASSQLAAGAAQVYTNSFASAAAIPLYGWAIAPGVATANLGIALAGMGSAGAAGAGIGTTLGGAAHGGLDNVPKETTYLLDKGERVVSPRQNQDLTNFLASQQGGGGIGKVEVYVNVTGRELKDLSPAELANLIADKMYPAMDRLTRSGVKPRYFNGAQ